AGLLRRPCLELAEQAPARPHPGDRGERLAYGEVERRGCPPPACWMVDAGAVRRRGSHRPAVVDRSAGLDDPHSRDGGLSGLDPRSRRGVALPWTAPTPPGSRARCPARDVEQSGRLVRTAHLGALRSRARAAPP